MKRFLSSISAVAIVVSMFAMPMAMMGCGEKDDSKSVIKDAQSSMTNDQKAARDSHVNKRRQEKKEAEAENKGGAPEAK